jgi:hypothetical protein
MKSAKIGNFWVARSSDEKDIWSKGYEYESVYNYFYIERE